MFIYLQVPISSVLHVVSASVVVVYSPIVLWLNPQPADILQCRSPLLNILMGCLDAFKTCLQLALDAVFLVVDVQAPLHSRPIVP